MTRRTPDGADLLSRGTATRNRVPAPTSGPMDATISAARSQVEDQHLVGAVLRERVGAADRDPHAGDQPALLGGRTVDDVRQQRPVRRRAR